MYEKLRLRVLPQLIPAKAKILVAVSGGPDSVALSHILWRYARDEKENEREISLVLSHVHHGVRPEADGEAEMVQELAAKWGLPLIVHRFNAKGYAQESGQSFQAAAREWRYARWREDMEREGCDLLATAHHLGDQAETVLYRLIRGSGTAGLAGIYPKKDRIIRPLLGVTKQELLEYCRQEGLPFALDRSNEEPIYVRNRIRLELIPELERNYNPQVLYALGRTAEVLRWDEEYLSAIVEEAWSRHLKIARPGRITLNLSAFKEPPAILSRLIRKAACLVTDEPRGIGFLYVQKILASQGTIGWRQNLPGLEVIVREDGLWFIRPELSGQDERLFLNFEKSLALGEWVNIPEVNSAVGLFPENNNSDEWREYAPAEVSEQALDNLCVNVAKFDAGELEKLELPLVCRTRRPGDKMWFYGVGHKELKKVFQEAGVPERERRNTLLIAAGSKVLWIPGVRRSDSCRPGNKRNVICLVKKLSERCMPGASDSL